MIELIALLTKSNEGIKKNFIINEKVIGNMLEEDYESIVFNIKQD